MTEPRTFDWSNSTRLPSKHYVCGHCGESLASNLGFMGISPQTKQAIGHIYICHFCERPTFIYGYPPDLPEEMQRTVQVPGSSFGDAVEHLPPKVGPLYEEIRNCMKVDAHTCAVLACRKLLMHIAVEKGAEEGKSFAEYVTFLHDNHWTPPESEAWVDSIRSKGNEANHKITISPRDDAEQLIDFAAMLLKFIYEYPKKIQSSQPEGPAPEK